MPNKKISKQIIFTYLAIVILLLINTLLFSNKTETLTELTMLPDTLKNFLLFESIILILGAILISIFAKKLSTNNLEIEQTNTDVTSNTDSITKITKNIELLSNGFYDVQLNQNVSDEYKILNTKLVELAEQIKNDSSTLSNQLNLISNGNFDESSKNTIKNKELNESFISLLNTVKNVHTVIETKANEISKGNYKFNKTKTNTLNGQWNDIATSFDSTAEIFVHDLDTIVSMIENFSNGNFIYPSENDDVYTYHQKECKKHILLTQDNLGDILRTIGEISNGNLLAKLNVKFSGDFEIITSTINNLVNSLTSILSEISDEAKEVLAESKFVYNSAQVLQDETVEQSKQLSILTENIKHISDTTESTSENMSQAKTLANSTSDKASSCNIKMDEMLISMQDIKEASNDISNIIKVIDEIAFQTNLLALNAAVESARAGVHGKGFAVVAEEVRNLAQRSQKAAKETTSLIETTVAKVNGGSQIANDTAEQLKEMVNDVSAISDVIDSVNITSKKQTEVINEFKEEIQDIDQRNQRTAQTSINCLNSTEELFASVDKLEVSANRFTFVNSINNSHSKTNNASAKPVASTPKVAPTPKVTPSKPVAPTPKVAPSKPVALTPKVAPSKPVASTPKVAPSKPVAPTPKVAPNKPVASTPKVAPSKPVASTPKVAPSKPTVSASKSEPEKTATSKPIVGFKNNMNTSSALTKRAEVTKPKSEYGLKNDVHLKDAPSKIIPTDDEIEAMISEKNFGKY